MARYFFHFSDGKRTFTDTTGVDLAGIAPARQHAGEQIRDMRCATPERALDWSGWKMVIADADGKTVFELGFDLKPVM
jgi:Domain of unknown function (DUF6894)